MKEYIKKLLDEVPYDTGGMAKTPAWPRHQLLTIYLVQMTMQINLQ